MWYHYLLNSNASSILNQNYLYSEYVAFYAILYNLCEGIKCTEIFN